MSTVDIPFLSTDTFREIFQSAAEGIIMVDMSGKILLANPVSEAMFGYEPGNLVGKVIEDLIPHGQRPKHHKHRENYSADPQPRRMGVGRDLTALRKDGSEFPVEVSLSNTSVNGNTYIVAFVIDITQRKSAEEALKKSEEQLIVYAAELEKKVLSRTEALNNTIRELEKVNEEARKALEKERELNELKTKFVSIASHEFRTPLSVILSSTTLIQKYASTNQWEKAESHTNRIKSSVNQLTLILNDFLSLGKLEEGKVELTNEGIVLRNFFQSLKEEIKPVLKPDQKIEVEIAGEEHEVETDPKILKNIMTNLISNGIKYSEPGCIIKIKIEFLQETVIIHVIDQGIGIPESDIKHIFDRFFRASNVSHVQGTGLGLNIVRRYAELLGGSIQFTSEERKGSTFSVTIPKNI